MSFCAVSLGAQAERILMLTCHYRERMVFPLWRSAFSVNLMLPKEERRAVLLRLFDDDTPLVNSTQKQEAAKAKAKEEINIAEYESEPEVNGKEHDEAEAEDMDADPEAEAEAPVAVQQVV